MAAEGSSPPPGGPRAVLGIETATPHGGAALALVGDGPTAGVPSLIAHRWGHARTGYSRRLMPAIDAMLAETGMARGGIAAIAVSHGPGSFTGVRVGLATAKTLAHALGVPLFVFSTLEGVAMRWPVVGALVCPVLDARRGEVYGALFRRVEDDRGALEVVRPEAAEPIADLLESLGGIHSDEPIGFTGDALEANWGVIRGALGQRARRVLPPWNLPGADSIALAGARELMGGERGMDPLLATPNYLRLSDAHKNAAHRKALQATP